ncbi:MAG: T9SS type A sorting domain-containing protein [Flavobacteriales bacterium]|nr:T9SS type A sorting domain-containing protein [Flavobacteriales bacterium]
MKLSVLKNPSYLLLALTLALPQILRAVDYPIDTYNGQTVTTCSGWFTDSNPSSTGNYANNEDYVVTFCSGSSSCLSFDFDNHTNAMIDMIAGDTLYVYDGTTIAGDLIMKIDRSDDVSFSQFMISTLSTCVTFRWISNGSGNDDGWRAKIACTTPPPDCNGNPAAADIALQAPFICNLDGYCGNTGNYYHEDLPNGMGSGGNCPSSNAFLGTVENNSWLKFEATSTSVSMDFTVSGCGSGGIQTAILQFNSGTNNWDRYSPCSLSDGTHNGTFALTASGLTIGDIYYIVADGNAGDNCNYTISVNGSSGLSTLNAGTDQLICSADPANLIATGPTGATYTWESLDGLITGASGANQTFFPIVTTSYVVTISGGNCLDQKDTVEVVISCSLPLEILAFEATAESDKVRLEWAANDYPTTSGYYIERSLDGHDFERIAFVSRVGANGTATNYIEYDNDPLSGRSYYRIAQLETDENVEYTAVRSVIFENVAFNLFPNPIGQGNELNIEHVSEGDQLQIFNTLGQKVMLKIILKNSISIPVDLPPGAYSVVLSNRFGGLLGTQRLVIY